MAGDKEERYEEQIEQAGRQAGRPWVKRKCSQLRWFCVLNCGNCCRFCCLSICCFCYCCCYCFYCCYCFCYCCCCFTVSQWSVQKHDAFSFGVCPFCLLCRWRWRRLQQLKQEHVAQPGVRVRNVFWPAHTVHIQAHTNGQAHTYILNDIVHKTCTHSERPTAFPARLRATPSPPAMPPKNAHTHTWLCTHTSIK